MGLAKEDRGHYFQVAKKFMSAQKESDPKDLHVPVTSPKVLKSS
jgi:hypothetical protein